MSNKKKILITVGTTQFQELIKFTDSQKFLNMLKQIKAKQFQILSQIGGKGIYQPINNKFIRLSDKISEIYKESDYIICHGGAGTLLENLYNNKKIISISNDSLSGNHQLQLIQKLSKEKYILGFQNVNEFKQSLFQIKRFFSDEIQFKKYEKPKKSIINQILFGEV